MMPTQVVSDVPLKISKSLATPHEIEKFAAGNKSTSLPDAGYVTFEHLVAKRPSAPAGDPSRRLSESLEDPYSWSDKPVRISPGLSDKGELVAKECNGFIIYSGDTSVSRVSRIQRSACTAMYLSSACVVDVRRGSIFLELTVANFTWCGWGFPR